MREPQSARRWAASFLGVLFSCLFETTGTLQPLFGGHLTWRADRDWNSGERTVTLSLTVAFAQSQGCRYAVGKQPQCVAFGAGCGALCTTARHHGVLCVAQLVPGNEPAAPQHRHVVAGDSCVSDLNLHSGRIETLGGKRAVGPDMVGGANNFTVTHLYDDRLSPSDADEFRTLGGARVAVGRLERVITVAPEATAIIAWLSSYGGTACADSRRCLLLRQCSDVAANTVAGPCSVNSIQAPWSNGSSSNATSDPYWGARGASALVDAVLHNESSALETFVPLCSSSGGGSHACSERPVRNFFSPVTVLPPLVEVAVTPLTRRSGTSNAASRFTGLSHDGTNDHFFSPHPPFAAKAYDSDNNIMVQYNPESADGQAEMGVFKKQRFEAACFLGVGHSGSVAGETIDEGIGMGPWPQTQCVGGDHDAATCNSSIQCRYHGACSQLWSRCRSFLDLDANPHRRQGNFLKFDFSFGGPQSGTPFGLANTPGRYSQHVLATADSGSMIGVGIGGGAALGKVPTWQQGSSATYSIFSAYPCDSGVANQPPVFVVSATSHSTRVPTDVYCYFGEACIVPLYARDYEMNSEGFQTGLQTSDTVRLELATGFSSPYDTSLVHVNGSRCQDNGAVCCLLELVPAAGTSPGAAERGRTEVRCVVAVDLHESSDAPTKRTCRSMPLCIKIHFVPLTSSDGLVTELGAPNARVIAKALPHLENQLAVSWNTLSIERAAQLGNVTVEVLRDDASVPHTLPNMSWPLDAREALVPVSALRAALMSNIKDAQSENMTGMQLRFRVIITTKSETRRFHGPWSTWMMVFQEPQSVPPLAVYAVSWASHRVSLWRLALMRNTTQSLSCHNESRLNQTCTEKGNSDFAHMSAGYALVDTFSSAGLTQGAVAIDNTMRQIFLIVSEPGQGPAAFVYEPPPIHQLLVVDLSTSTVLRRLDLAIDPGVIWNVEFDEAQGQLVAASIVGEGSDAVTRLVSIRTDSGAVSVLYELSSPVVFGVSAFDRYSRSYFFVETVRMRPRMFAMLSGALSEPFELESPQLAGAGEVAHRVALAMGFEAASGLLFALTSEWPGTDDSTVFLTRYDPSANRVVSISPTILRNSHVRFASFLFDFVQMQILVSQRAMDARAGVERGRMLVYTYQHDSIASEDLGAMSPVMLSMVAHEYRVPEVEIVIPSKVVADSSASVNITIVGSNFGVKPYPSEVFLDMLRCVSVRSFSDSEITCTLEGDSKVEGVFRRGHDIASVDITTRVIDREGSRTKAFTFAEFWTHISPASSCVHESCLGSRITVYGRAFVADSLSNVYGYRLLLTADERGVVSAPPVVGSENLLVFDAPLWTHSAGRCEVRLLHDPQSEKFATSFTGHLALLQHVTNQVANYTYRESWFAVAPTRGFASYQGEITVRGSGFDPERGDYACEFDGFSGLVDAEPLSHREVRCRLPVWNQSADGVTRIYLRNHGIRVSRYSEEPSDVLNTNVSASFFVVQTWDALDPSRSPVEGGVTMTVQGAGFHRRQSYACVFEDALNGLSTVAAHVIDHTNITCTTPHVARGATGTVMLVMDNHFNVGAYDFEFLPSGPRVVPTTARATGGTVVVVYAWGLLDVNGTYACAFSALDYQVWSQNVTASSVESISCYTPFWGEAAGMISVRVWSWAAGQFIVSLPFEMTALVHAIQPTRVAAGEQVVYIITGVGLNRSSPEYLCELKDPTTQMAVMSGPAAPANDTTMICPQMAWTFVGGQTVRARLVLGSALPSGDSGSGSGSHSASDSGSVFSDMPLDVTVFQVFAKVVPSTVSACGVAVVTVVGAGFDDKELSKYSCVFRPYCTSANCFSSFEENVAFQETKVVSILNRTHLVCNAPAWVRDAGTIPIDLPCSANCSNRCFADHASNRTEYLGCEDQCIALSMSSAIASYNASVTMGVRYGASVTNVSYTRENFKMLWSFFGDVRPVVLFVMGEITQVIPSSGLVHGNELVTVTGCGFPYTKGEFDPNIRIRARFSTSISSCGENLTMTYCVLKTNTSVVCPTLIIRAADEGRLWLTIEIVHAANASESWFTPKSSGRLLGSLAFQLAADFETVSPSVAPASSPVEIMVEGYAFRRQGNYSCQFISNGMPMVKVMGGTVSISSSTPAPQAWLRLNNRPHRLGRHLSNAIEIASGSGSEDEGSMPGSGIESAGGSGSVYAEPTACTTDGYTGPNCQACDKDTYAGSCQDKCNAKSTCSKNGRCSGLDGRCICNEGFSGPSCSITTELTSTPSDTLPVMNMKIGLPLSKAEFTPVVQALVREAIAAAVGVDARRVRILSVVEAARRRLLAYSLTLEIAIEMPPGESRLDTMTANSTMTANNLNRELVARNLPQATMLEPPIIVYQPIVPMAHTVYSPSCTHKVCTVLQVQIPNTAILIEKSPCALNTSIGAANITGLDALNTNNTYIVPGISESCISEVLIKSFANAARVNLSWVKTYDMKRESSGHHVEVEIRASSVSEAADIIAAVTDENVVRSALEMQGFHANALVLEIVLISNNPEDSPVMRGRIISMPGEFVNSNLLRCSTPVWPYQSGPFAFAVSDGEDLLGVTGSTRSFRFTPEIWAMSPDRGLVGSSTVVSITGSGLDASRRSASYICAFQDDLGRKSFNSTKVRAQYDQTNEAQLLTCAVPDWSFGAGMVTVRVADTLDDTWILPRNGTAVEFRFQLLEVVHEVQPAAGPASGGFAISILGRGFQNDSLYTALFERGGVNVSVNAHVFKESMLVVTAPKFPAAAGQVQLSILRTNGAVNGSARFTYNEFVGRFYPDRGGVFGAYVTVEGTFGIGKLYEFRLSPVRPGPVPNISAFAEARAFDVLEFELPPWNYAAQLMGAHILHNGSAIHFAGQSLHFVLTSGWIVASLPKVTNFHGGMQITIKGRGFDTMLPAGYTCELLDASMSECPLDDARCRKHSSLDYTLPESYRRPVNATSTTEIECWVPTWLHKNPKAILRLLAGKTIVEKVYSGVQSTEFVGKPFVANSGNSPTSGRVAVTLKGADFGLTDLTQKARIGRSACESTKWLSSTSLSCVVPTAVNGTLTTGIAVTVGPWRIGTAKRGFVFDGLMCHPGTFSDVVNGIKTCSLCIAGKFSAGQIWSSELATTACTDCPAFASSPASSESISNCTCNAGYAGQDGQICLACAPGTYKNETGARPCLQCGKGQYASSPASKVCSLCPSGKASSVIGASRCLTCVEGTFFPNTQGATQCFICPAGKVLPVVGSSIANCTGDIIAVQANTQISVNASTFNRFAADFTASVAQAAAVPVDRVRIVSITEVSNSRRLLATSVIITFEILVARADGAGTAQMVSDKLNEIIAEKGLPETLVLGILKTCGVGQAPNNETLQCDPCAKGYYKEEVSNQSCSACPLNTYGTERGATTMSVCLPCLGGSTSVNGSDACSCRPGTTGPPGSCDLCGAGKFKTVDGTEACATCSAGKYSQVGFSECINCPENTFSEAGSTSQSECVCNAGYTQGPGGVCDACDYGTFKSGNGSYPCEACPSGTFSPLRGLNSR
jgi:hypothetical protein